MPFLKIPLALILEREELVAIARGREEGDVEGVKPAKEMEVESWRERERGSSLGG